MSPVDGPWHYGCRPVSRRWRGSVEPRPHVQRRPAAADADAGGRSSPRSRGRSALRPRLDRAVPAARPEPASPKRQSGGGRSRRVSVRRRAAAAASGHSQARPLRTDVVASCALRPNWSPSGIASRPIPIGADARPPACLDHDDVAVRRPATVHSRRTEPDDRRSPPARDRRPLGDDAGSRPAALASARGTRRRRRCRCPCGPSPPRPRRSCRARSGHPRRRAPRPRARAARVLGVAWPALCGGAWRYEVTARKFAPRAGDLGPPARTQYIQPPGDPDLVERFASLVRKTFHRLRRRPSSRNVLGSNPHNFMRRRRPPASPPSALTLPAPLHQRGEHRAGVLRDVEERLWIDPEEQRRERRHDGDRPTLELARRRAAAPTPPRHRASSEPPATLGRRPPAERRVRARRASGAGASTPPRPPAGSTRARSPSRARSPRRARRSRCRRPRRSGRSCRRSPRWPGSRPATSIAIVIGHASHGRSAPRPVERGDVVAAAGLALARDDHRERGEVHQQVDGEVEDRRLRRRAASRPRRRRACSRPARPTSTPAAA